nr:MAG TPA: hypothetical protein [Caudoviricetes sp.]
MPFLPKCITLSSPLIVIPDGFIYISVLLFEIALMLAVPNTALPSLLSIIRSLSILYLDVTV